MTVLRPPEYWQRVGAKSSIEEVHVHERKVMPRQEGQKVLDLNPGARK